MAGIGCLIRCRYVWVFGGQVGLCFVLGFIVFWLYGFGVLGISEAML